MENLTAKDKKKLSKDIFIQTETITLSNEVGKYPVVLNSNYKYCNGIIVNSGIDCTFGIIDKGVYILDEAPLFIYQPANTMKFEEKIIPLNTPAKGTQKYVYFDKRGVVVPSIDVMFILSNEETPDYKKRNVSFDILPLIVGVNTGQIYFNNYMKNVIGYNFDHLIVGVSPISLSSFNKFIFQNIATNTLALTNVPYKEKFIPVKHSCDVIDFEMTVPAIPGNYFIVYEYEPF